MVSIVLLSLLGGWPAAALQEVPAAAEADSALSRASGEGAIGVGTHLFWRVTIDDPGTDEATLAAPAFGPEWAVIDGPRDIVDASLPKGSRPDLVREWTLMPLAGGTLSTPELTATLGDETMITVASDTVEVLPSLGETEEAPRPLLGFRTAPDRRVGDPRTALATVFGLLLAALLFWLWRRSVKRRRSEEATAPPEPTAMEQLRALQDDGQNDVTPGELAPLFRRAFDAELPPEERLRRSSLTDEAWGREVEAQGGVGPDAARLIHELSGYRYSGGEPTSFAVKDALKRAVELSVSAAAAASKEAAA